MSAFIGSVSGSSKSGHEEFFDKFLHEVLGYGNVSNQVTGSNVGDGTLTGADGRANAVTESITLTAQAGGTAFDVVGSVSGSMGTAYVDHTYDDGVITFEINTGGVAFDEGDDFTFDVTEGQAAADGVAWTLLYEAGGGSEGKAWIQAPGNSSDDNIYMYIRHFKDIATGYYNLEFLMCTGYDADKVDYPTNQVGASPYGYVCFWQNSIDYWIVVNAQRIAFAAKVNTNYMHFYGGFFHPDALPNEYPIPMFLGCCSDTSSTKHTSTAADHTFYCDTDNSSWVLGPDSVWYELDTGDNHMFPWEDNAQGPSLDSQGPGPGGGYMPIPATIFFDSGVSRNGVLGDLDGVVAIPGRDNASENDFVWGSSTYIIFQNIFRTGGDDYLALKME